MRRRINELKCVARARVHAASNRRQWHSGLAFAVVYIVAAAEVFHCGDCPFGFDMNRRKKRNFQEAAIFHLTLSPCARSPFHEQTPRRRYCYYYYYYCHIVYCYSKQTEVNMAT